MGGWFLEPDCNMPSGEGIVRQTLTGRQFFGKHFKSVPSVAVNFDTFGHSKGLVKILAKSGFKAYFFYRPYNNQYDLPSEVFKWEGFNSSVVGIRLPPYLAALGGARKILREIRASAFFTLLSSTNRVSKETSNMQTIPIVVYNPHPYELETIVDCEFQMAEQNLEETFTDVQVYAGQKQLATQVEKEASNINLDWRKHVIFKTTLKPCQMHKFDCKLIRLPARPCYKNNESKTIFLKNKKIQVKINASTGCIDEYIVNGKSLIRQGACRSLVVEDCPDPWGVKVNSFRKVIGSFKVISKKETTSFANLPEPISPAKIIEDGAVRTVVEVLLKYGGSRAIVHYKIPKEGTEVEIECRIYWNEIDKMLKLSLPFGYNNAAAITQTMFGIEPIPDNGVEWVTQKWCILFSKDKHSALSCINDTTYGCDFKDSELRLSMLRSPAYAAHPIGERPIVQQDRVTPRIDQGEHIFRFWLNGGNYQERIRLISNETELKYEKPFALAVSPLTKIIKCTPFLRLTNKAVELVAAKKAEDNDDIILRLFETTGSPQKTELSFPSMKRKIKIKFAPFEIKTFRIDKETKQIIETDLLEKPL